MPCPHLDAIARSSFARRSPLTKRGLRWRFALGLIAWSTGSACTRTTSPETVTPDPTTKAQPSASASPGPLTFKGPRACEPTVRCGFWTGCVWLEPIDERRYRALGGADKGSVFVRRHDCSPSDAGPAGCAVYCTGADGGPPCVDALHPENEPCDETAKPAPNSTRCLVGAGICGSLM